MRKAPAARAVAMQMLTCTGCGGLTPRDSSPTCLHCDAHLPRAPRWARRLSALLGPAGAILLAACYGGPGRYGRSSDYPQGMTRQDLDHDGSPGPWMCAGGYSRQRCEDELTRMPPPPNLDCDDNDPKRYPGAEDIDGDGIDQNCDGIDGWRDPNTVVQPIPTDPAADPVHGTVPAPTP